MLMLRCLVTKLRFPTSFWRVRNLLKDSQGRMFCASHIPASAMIQSYRGIDGCPFKSLFNLLNPISVAEEVKYAIN